MNNHFLVVVDMQNDFITGSLGSQNAQNIIPRVIKKIFTHFGPIVATMDSHIGNTYHETLEGRKLPVVHCVEQSNGWEIQRDVAKAIIAHGNYIGYIKKQTFGTFELIDVINQYMKLNHQIESPSYNAPALNQPEFTIIGLDTDICVISNALILRAAFPNSKITIDSRCCAGTTPHNHRAALDVAKSCQIDVI